MIAGMTFISASVKYSTVKTGFEIGPQNTSASVFSLEPDVNLKGGGHVQELAADRNLTSTYCSWIRRMDVIVESTTGGGGGVRGIPAC